MFKKISGSVWKLNVDSNIYFLDLNQKIVIDTGPREYKNIIENSFKKLISFKKIQKVIFTHLHYDHSGNFDLFPNADFLASNETIEDFKKDPLNSILDPDLAEEFNINLKPIQEFGGLKIIKTPGHTRGSICLWHEKEKVLFTGDTLFCNGIGRTDLPTSAPEKMQESLDKLKSYKHKILAPGHDY